MSKENTLFNDTTIKRLVAGTNLTIKQKKAVKIWLGYLQNKKLENEKEAYIEFANVILKDLLNYDISLNGLKHEEANIEFLFKKEGNNLICFEAKGAKTKDLWAYQGRDRKSRETPVNQINSYMYEQKIPFGILTNYHFFVLFDRNEGSKKYHLIDFTELTNENKLKEFVALFSKEQVEKGFISEVIQKSIIEEKEFTKEFYKLYHETRLMLIKEFENNSEISREASVHFAQLYLNRLMFVFFAEDTGKIDWRIIENRVIKTLDSIHLFSSNSSNISNVLVGLFKDLDKGSDFPVKLFGFNGGLFSHPIPPKIYFKDFRGNNFFKDVNKYSKLKKKDLELNEEQKKTFEKYKNKISPIVRNILLMAAHDFNTEVNVNILGHIFEQSISDIEDLKTDKSSRRKKDGVFYTPEYITDYICRNTIIPYLSKKNVNTVPNLIKEYAENISELEEKFKSIKILDPACGSGAFLIKATDIMLEIFKEIQKFKLSEGEYEAKKGLKKKSNTKGQIVLSKWHEEDEAREIIENSIHGVDINEESVEITKLSLFLKMARRNRKLTNLSGNIKRGNSLIDDPDVAGDLAFNWDKEFPFKFDVVVGNPPWNSKITDSQNTYFSKKYNVDKKNLNIFLIFLKLSLSLIKEYGVFCLLVPKVVIKNNSYIEFRKKTILENSLLGLFDFGKFPGVASDAVALVISRGIHKEQLTKISSTKNDQHNIKFIKQDIFSKNSIFAFSFSLNDDLQKVLDKMNYTHLLIKDICRIKRGIESGQVSNYSKCSKCGNLNVISTKYYSKDKNLCVKCKFDFSNENIVSISSRERTSFYDTACISGKEIDRYLVKNSYFIPSEFSKFIDFKDDAFSSERIFLKRIATKPEAVFVDEKLYSFNTVYSLYSFVDDINIKYTLILLNSKMMEFYYENTYNLGMSLTTQVTIDFLRKIPIKNISPSEQKPFIEKADSMLKLNKVFYEKKDKFLKLIKHEYKIEKITRKLDQFYESEFDDFMKQLKVNLNMDKKAEILDFFEKNKKELQHLKAQIEKTDYEIDQMVYKLYGLSKDEIAIVEESLK